MTFSDGASAFFSGFGLLRRRRLIAFVIVPVGLSAAIIGIGASFAIDGIAWLATWVTERVPGWLDWLGQVLTVLLWIIAGLAGTWLLAFVAVLVGSPFMGELSSRVEALDGGIAPESNHSFGRALWETVVRELRKLAYILPRALLVFLLSLVPIINVAAPALWLLFGSWIMALQFSDYAAENRDLPLRDTLDLLAANRGAALGFGVCATLAMAVPLLNVIAIPAAVAGGTLLWLQLDGLDTGHEDERPLSP